MKKQLKKDMPIVRVYLSPEIKRQFKTHAAANETTIQQILESHVTKVLREKDGVKKQ